MRSALILGLLVLCVLSCNMKDETLAVKGKWYTYAESGDYMELWLGEDKAMSYLSGIDEFLLYDLKQDGNMLKFSLIESRITDEHQFQLIVNKSSGELFQATFIGGEKVDSLKTYFLVDSKVPEIKASLEANRDNMQELLSRMEGSHAGHGH